MGKTNNGGIIAAIIVAGVLISGSLVYLGMSGNMGVSEDDLKTAVIDGFQDIISGNVPTEGEEVVEEGTNGAASDINAADFMDDDAVLGDKDAPVTIVEFSDYECPYCATFFEETHSQIVEKYINTGQAKLVFRDFPLDFHAGAMPAAIAAECVRAQTDDAGYFEMHDLIFENQSVLSTEDVNAELKTLAAQVEGVGEAEFATCLDNEEYREEALADMADGRSVGISGTPSFLINGEMLQGAYPFSEFERIIEAELAK